MNQVVLTGNIGRDTEMRYTQNGTAVASASLAVSEKWTGKDGSKQEKTIWVRLSFWGKQAENAHKIIKKGTGLLVVGSLEESSAFMGQDGKPRASTEVKVRTFEITKWVDDAQNNDAANGESSYTPASSNLDDIPF
jgi:single-strand DNA-binding protein